MHDSRYVIRVDLYFEYNIPSDKFFEHFENCDDFFDCFDDFDDFPGQFLAQNLGFYDENPGFSGFFRFVTNFEQL